MKKLLFLIPLLAIVFSIQAKNKSGDSVNAAMAVLDSVMKIDQAIKYKTGLVDLNSEVNLNIPAGYKFMERSDAENVVYQIWGNPSTPDNPVLGLIVKEDYNILNSEEWALVVRYEDAGYVKDEDADKIDYKEMMEQIHESEKEENKDRVKAGYGTVHIIDWAIQPYYDKKNNVLHWAKAIKFGDSEDTTLNYDVRVLGRRGLLSMNAVGVMQQLEDIKSQVPVIMSMAKFKKGSTYSEFSPGVDKVAAYTIGGLIAGKLLAKAGLIALLLKNIKLILIGITAFFGGFGKKIIGFFRRKKEETNTTFES